MVTFLKKHPFAVEAFFNSSLVLTFAAPKAALQPLIPPCTELDTFNDTWGFIAVALVQTKGLRPKGFPKILGNDFFLIGYRIFVRYTTNEGKRLRGLYILKSETDKKKMEWLGNIFTQYSYTTTDISSTHLQGSLQVKSEQSGLHIVADSSSTEVALPPNSPFANWKEARRFAGPLPFTFSYNATAKKVLIIEGVRTQWQPQPVAIKQCEVAFLQTLQLSSANLASAFVVNNIPYYWKKGKTETWKR